MTDPQTTWWLRKIVVWGIWIGVGIVMIPLARRKRESALKWYFLGLGAFYGPLLAIAYGPIFLSVLVDRDPRDRQMFKAVMDHFTFLLSAGFSAGVAGLFWLRRRLERRPEP